jgi:preprotein translocase SecE subunit
MKIKNLASFLEEAKTEILKITWLSKKELYTSSFSVLMIVIMFSLFFLLTDLIVSNFVNYILGIS